MISSPRRERRGLAMPMVLLLVMIAGVLLTVILQRQDASTRDVGRRLLAYQDLHAQRGLQEITEMWLSFYVRGDINALLQDDGLAFELELADRSRVLVYLEEAQGSARRELSGLGRAPRADAEGVISELSDLLGGAARLEDRDPLGRPYTRAVGPVAISLATAPRPVLVAAALSALGDGRRAETLADAILDQRLGGDASVAFEEIDPLGEAIDLIDADDDERDRLERLLTAQPRLWWFRIELRGTELGRPNDLAAVYGGYLHTSAGESTPRDDEAGARVEGRGSFLTWDRLDLDDPMAGSPRSR